jgi:hypothetical protein
MALFLTGSHTFKKPEMKMSLPTIYIFLGIRKIYAIVSIPLNWKYRIP